MLHTLMTRKKRLESDIQQPEWSADEFAEKAEATRNMTFIVKSNSLWHSAKNNTESLSDLGKDIEVKK